MAHLWPSSRLHVGRAILVLLLPTLALVAAAPPERVAAATAPTYVDLDLGNLHGCVAMSDGTVRCWGNDRQGQIGDGTKGDASGFRPVPRQVVGLTGAVEVTVGGSHSCARRGDGTVRCWGSAAYGQLGDGSSGEFVTKTSPVTVSGLSDAVSIAAGGIHTCAARSNGTVACWGSNSRGQLGDGTTGDANQVRISPVQVSGVIGASKVVAADSTTCALLTGGTVACWGWAGAGQVGDGTTGDGLHRRLSAVSATGLTGVTDLAGGADHLCASTVGGTVRCWGANGGGQVGTGALSLSVPVPTLVPNLNDAVGVGAGSDHSCVLRANGVVGCWGAAQYGQIGDGTEGDASGVRLVPTAASGIGTATHVDAGGRTTCALLGSSTARCWGDGAFAQLGNGTGVAGTSVESLLPVTVASTPGAPAAPTAVVAKGSATVTWAAPGSNGGSSITGAEVVTSPGGAVTHGTCPEVVVSGLVYGSPYTFTVRLTNAAGTGRPDIESSTVTVSEP